MEAAKVGSIEGARTAQRFMQVPVKGRIESSKVYEGSRYTKIIVPAADAYSKPQKVEIRSKSRLGDAGEEGIWMATLGGYERKAYTVRDDSTGEITKVTPVQMTLDLVEPN